MKKKFFLFAVFVSLSLGLANFAQAGFLDEIKGLTGGGGAKNTDQTKNPDQPEKSDQPKTEKSGGGLGGLFGNQPKAGGSGGGIVVIDY